jgi:hypothetical protein
MSADSNLESVDSGEALSSAGHGAAAETAHLLGLDAPVVGRSRITEDEVSRIRERLFANGYRVVPVVTGDKRPTMPDWPERARVQTVQEARVFGVGFANTGILCDGLRAVDIDCDDLVLAKRITSLAVEILGTAPMRTRPNSSRVLLLYSAATGQPRKRRLGHSPHGVEVLGYGQQFVAFGKHPTGADYEWTDNSPLTLQRDALPAITEKQIENFLGLCRPVLDVPEAASSKRDRLAPKIAQENQRTIGPGKRRPLIFKVAAKLHAEGVPTEGKLAACHALNKTFCPPLEDAQVEKTVYGTERYPGGHLPTERVPEIICLADRTALPVPWLWKGYLALGMLAMLSGDPSSGKTYISLAIAADLSNGRIPITGEPCNPMTTLYLSRENSPEYVLRPRFDALGGDPSRFHVLVGGLQDSGVDTVRSGVTLKDIDLLEAAAQMTGAKLIVIDPIQSYLGAEVDAHRSNETRPVMDGLIGIAERLGVCLLLVRHLSKASGGRAIHRGLGSIDLTGAVRTEMIAGSSASDQDARALVQIKNNLGPLADSVAYEIVGREMEARLEWRGKSELTSADILAPDAEVEGRSDIAEAADYLRKQLESGPKLQKDLESASGFSERTLQRAAQRVGIDRTRDGQRGPWFWALKQHPRQDCASPTTPRTVGEANRSRLGSHGGGTACPAPLSQETDGVFSAETTADGATEFVNVEV